MIHLQFTNTLNNHPKNHKSKYYYHTKEPIEPLIVQKDIKESKDSFFQALVDAYNKTHINELTGKFGSLMQLQLPVKTNDMLNRFTTNYQNHNLFRQNKQLQLDIKKASPVNNEVYDRSLIKEHIIDLNIVNSLNNNDEYGHVMRIINHPKYIYRFKPYFKKLKTKHLFNLIENNENISQHDKNKFYMLEGYNSANMFNKFEQLIKNNQSVEQIIDTNVFLNENIQNNYKLYNILKTIIENNQQIPPYIPHERYLIPIINQHPEFLSHPLFGEYIANIKPKENLERIIANIINDYDQFDNPFNDDFETMVKQPITLAQKKKRKKYIAQFQQAFPEIKKHEHSAIIRSGIKTFNLEKINRTFNQNIQELYDISAKFYETFNGLTTNDIYDDEDLVDTYADLLEEYDYIVEKIEKIIKTSHQSFNQLQLPTQDDTLITKEIKQTLNTIICKQLVHNTHISTKLLKQLLKQTDVNENTPSISTNQTRTSINYINQKNHIQQKNKYIFYKDHYFEYHESIFNNTNVKQLLTSRPHLRLNKPMINTSKLSTYAYIPIQNNNKPLNSNQYNQMMINILTVINEIGDNIHEKYNNIHDMEFTLEKILQHQPNKKPIKQIKQLLENIIEIKNHNDSNQSTQLRILSAITSSLIEPILELYPKQFRLVKPIILPEK